MSYPYYGYQQPQYYQPPMPDQLAQLRGAQFQPMPQQMPQAQPQQAQASGQSMVWVSGEAEAMAYLVAPNSAVALWDSNSPTIYLKQADASGKPSIKVYDLVERTSGARTAQAPQGVEFATKADLEALAARVDALAAPENSSVVGDYGDSDFLRAASGVDQHDAWAIMDDLMDTLHTVNPRVYEGVMRKIRAL